MSGNYPRPFQFVGSELLLEERNLTIVPRHHELI
jgi:hypothetical protein